MENRLLKKDRRIDKGLANLLNKIETIQLEDFKAQPRIINGKVGELTSRLYRYLIEHTERVKKHSDEIKECMKGLMKCYAESGVIPPYKTRVLYFNTLPTI